MPFSQIELILGAKNEDLPDLIQKFGTKLYPKTDIFWTF